METNIQLQDNISWLRPEDAPSYYQDLYPVMLREMIKRGNDPRRVFIGNPQGKEILDFGCGNGQITENLVGNNNIWGLDISPSLVEEAKTKGINAQVLDVDREKLPFPSDSFDLVYAFDVFEHIFKLDDVLEELHRVTQKTGLLIVTVPVLKPGTIEDNISFHRGIIADLGKDDSPFADMEPEIGLRTFSDWVEIFSSHGFSPITRAFGFSWDRDLDDRQRQDIFMSPNSAGNVCFILGKRPSDLEIASGVLSRYEMMTGLRLFP